MKAFRRLFTPTAPDGNACGRGLRFLVVLLAVLGLGSHAQAANSLGTTGLVEGPGAGSDSVLLTAAGAWTASTTTSWLHVSSGSASGTGNATVLFTYDANSSGTRTGTFTIAAQTLTVTQAGSTFVAASPFTTLISPTQAPLSSGAPAGLVVDASGNVYIADLVQKALYKYAVANQAITTPVSTMLAGPAGLAMDGSGNIYIADSNLSGSTGALFKYSTSGSSLSTLVSIGLTSPSGVALDSSGNVYIADGGNVAVDLYNPSTSALSKFVSTGLTSPQDVALDASGNLYIADVGAGMIFEQAAGSQTLTTLVQSSQGMVTPQEIVVDGSGNLYIADSGNASVEVYSPVTQTLTTLLPSSAGLYEPEAVAIDASRNVYVADFGNSSVGPSVKELPRAFVDLTAKTEPAAGGSDTLSAVLPTATNLLAPFAPTSNQGWLTITSTSGGVVHFSCSANISYTRTAQISLLGQTISVTQAGPTSPVNYDTPGLPVYPVNPAIYVKGTAITTNTPTSTGGGTAASYAISPTTLPTGLSFSTTTGAISGTPTAASAATNYTVTASNTAGASQGATLTITVLNGPPGAPSYPSNPAVYTIGTAITANTPTTTNSPASYSISPTALPLGLSFSTTTGAITGTPTVITPATTYKVTAYNAAGSSSATTLTITVNNAVPSTPTYSTNPATYTVGTAIAVNTPTANGAGLATSWTLTGTLPAGLVFSTLNGSISGTPTATSPATNYTITANDSAGSSPAVTLSITVNNAAPGAPVYTPNPATYQVGMPITANTPASGGGGPATSYSISGTLPAGLSFSTTTGAIFGTPNTVTTATSVAVTAHNSVGASTATTVSITVIPLIPSVPVYPTNPAVYTVGTAIVTNTPTSTAGGTPSTWTLTGTLPAGLSFSTSTGAISGTPTVLMPATSYSVTANNAGGSSPPATLTITVGAVVGSAPVYPINPAIYTVGMTVATDTPTSNGGTPTSWTLTGTLPPGLVFSTLTGAIAGAPTAITPATAYMVTANNSGGSTPPVTLTIEVNDVVPSPPIYAANPAVYTKGKAIATNTPTSTAGGTPTSYTLTGTLPPGLVFSTSTGAITGIPTALAPATNYTVTANNSGGYSTPTTLSITVNDIPPAAPVYPTNPAVYTRGSAVTVNTPTSTGGGAPTSWTLTGTLPAGLLFSTSTGAISGTPTAVSPATMYSVTANSTGGASPPTTLTLQVNDAIPATPIYPTNPTTFTKGEPVIADIPTSTGGGTATSWTLTGTLPAGLSFSTGTGAISGTPTAVSAATAYAVTANSSGGDSSPVMLTITVNDVVPAAPVYATNPAVYTKGAPISLNTPASTGGGAPTSWTLTGTLPAGLLFSTSTGVISGTPTALSPATVYTVTANDSGGSSTATSLTITVNDVVPSAPVYAINPAVYTKGTAIATNTPVSTGGGAPTSYTLTGVLPAGLAFSTTTGAISGAPSAVTAATSVTVTANNSGGSSPATTLSITVNDAVPSSLQYATNPATYTKGTPIPTNTPILTGGGTPTSYTLTGALPAGLSFSTSTGTISGTPTAPAPATGYTITANNTGGSSSPVTLTITVDDVAPAAPIYQSNAPVYTKGTAIAVNTATWLSGGAPTSYTLTGTLPSGLSFSTSTGSISGTPTAISPAMNYPVTANNSGGSSAATVLSITVNDVAPAAPVYPANPAIYTTGAPIVANAPTSTGGGTPTSWTLSGTLPAGLSFSTATGTISGTPTALSPSTNYTVTANNSGGSSAPTTVTISVNTAPGAPIYPTNPAIYTKGSVIAPNTPSANGGGTPTSWTLTGALPAGLTFSTSTGTISGTPTALSTTASYTVTANNSGGPSAATTLTITVNDAVPAAPVFPTNPATYTKGSAITPNTPTANGGGVPTSWTLTGTLPAGLSFSTSTGAITGTPAATSPATGYAVTANNSGGSSRATTLTIAVNDAAPSALVYSINPAIYAAGLAIPANTPSNAGGLAVSYSVSPSLPAGLLLNPTTGVLTGTPSALSAPANYTVTATDAGGSTTTPLNIAVVPPYALAVSSLTEGPAEGSDSVVLTVTPASGSWTAVANAPWLQVAAGSASGAGSANVIFTFQANSGSTRTGTLTIGGQTLTVIQAGAAYAATDEVTALVATGLKFPGGVAVDGAGNVYIADTANSAIKKWTAATQTVTTLVSTGLNNPSGVAVDGLGNVYIADSFNAAIKKWSVATQAVSTLVSGQDLPYSVALDGFGNVYFSVIGGAGNYVAEWVAANGQIAMVIPAGSTTPRGLAVDAAGNIYIANASSAAIEEYTAATQTVSTLISSGLNDPVGVAVDGSGNVYIADSGSNAIRKWTPSSQTLTPLVATGLKNPQGVAVDAAGDVFIADYQNNAIKELPYVLLEPAALAEGGAAGSDALPRLLPASVNLRPPFAPISSQSWLTIGALSSGVVNFSFSENDTAPRTAEISLYGQQFVVSQSSLAPYGLAYSAPVATYTVGIPVADNTPSSAGGPVVSYTVSPALPAGLVLSPSTGAIAGTPTAVAAAAVYTVTAANSYGDATASLTITVDDALPEAASQSLIATTGEPAAITLSAAELIPDQTTYTLLQLPLHGVLRGTPPNLEYTSDPTYAGSDAFTYRASDRGGSSDATVTIEVYPPVSSEGYYSGKFVGLISGADLAHSGTISITSVGTGAFTASISYGGVTYALSGVYNAQGQYSLNIAHAGAPSLTGTLSFGLPYGSDAITGTINGSTLTASRALYSATAPASQAGIYTVQIPPDPTQTNGADAPQGFGVGTLTVTPSGSITFAGVLADGTKLSRGTSLTRNGVWYLFVPLYAASGPLEGMLEGTIQFQATPQVSALDGAVSWFRPALTKPYPSTAFYPAGFELSTHLYGAAYSPKGSLVLTLGSANNTFIAEGGSVSGGVLNEAALVGKAAAAFKVSGANSLTLTVTTAAGLITGSFKETAASAPSPVHAVIYQNGPAPSIVGNFTDQPKSGTNEGGAVALTSP